jgi:hypothetical protein
MRIEKRLQPKKTISEKPGLFNKPVFCCYANLTHPPTLEGGLRVLCH